jgi:glutamine phosphoribosylpyrophosphate amidotransferase
MAAHTDTGAQPLTNEDGTLILAVNGEIYNHRALRKSLKQPAVFKTHSDCEVIMHLVSQRKRYPGSYELIEPPTSTRSTEPPSAASSTACSPSSSSTLPSPPPA